MLTFSASDRSDVALFGIVDRQNSSSPAVYCFSDVGRHGDAGSSHSNEVQQSVSHFDGRQFFNKYRRLHSGSPPILMDDEAGSVPIVLQRFVTVNGGASA